jgi:hypothetical protein
MILENLQFVYTVDRYDYVRKLPVKKVTEKSVIVGLDRIPKKELEKGSWLKKSTDNMQDGRIYYLPNSILAKKFKAQCQFEYIQMFINRCEAKKLYEQHPDIYRLILSKLPKGEQDGR